MTRIAIIGNSHVAAFKLAWGAIAPRHPDIEIEFFAAPGIHARRLGLKPGLRFAPLVGPYGADPAARALVRRINGRTDIDLSQADCVLCVGGNHPVFKILQVFAEFEIEGIGDAADIGTTPQGRDQPRDAPQRQLSCAAFGAICEAVVAETLPGPEWRNWTRPRLIYFPQHQPTEAVLDRKTPRPMLWRRLVASADGGAGCLAAYFNAFEAGLAAMGIEIFRQPPETLGATVLTARRFGIGSRQLVGALHRDDEAGHMNADYGAICLDALFARLRAAPRAPAVAAAAS